VLSPARDSVAPGFAARGVREVHLFCFPNWLLLPRFSRCVQEDYDFKRDLCYMSLIKFRTGTFVHEIASPPAFVAEVVLPF
jgi:hypothetical protein